MCIINFKLYTSIILNLISFQIRFQYSFTLIFFYTFCAYILCLLWSYYNLIYYPKYTNLLYQYIIFIYILHLLYMCVCVIPFFIYIYVSRTFSHCCVQIFISYKLTRLYLFLIFIFKYLIINSLQYFFNLLTSPSIFICNFYPK